MILLLAMLAVSAAAGAEPPASALTSRPNYHLIGWTNTFVPGAGQVWLGDPLRGGAEAALEMGTFAWGYSMSRLSPMSLDGVSEQLPQFGPKQRRSSSQVSLVRPLYADILQELGLKAHMVNTFNAYRDAAARAGVTEGIDQRSTMDMFLSPFQKENVLNPWVLVPLGAVAAFVAVDYGISYNSGLPNVPRLTPYTNALYAFHYGAWQPFGSGAPEEMFYRGFLQNELYSLVPSPYFALPLSAAAFAFSHAPGSGRINAGVVGLYLGVLAYRNHGNLAPGMTLHFWSVVLLGLETILLSHDAQRTTPPATFSVQFNY